MFNNNKKIQNLHYIFITSKDVRKRTFFARPFFWLALLTPRILHHNCLLGENPFFFCFNVLILATNNI